MFLRKHASGRIRIPVTNPREIRRPLASKRAHARPLPFDVVIDTLDPNKFAEKRQQRLHIGNLTSFQPCISLHEQSSRVIAPRLYYDKTANPDPRIPPYPPDTKAFLYYSMSPEKPRIAGELRLRVASSDDPASFESGSDLLLTNGQPWSRPLYPLFFSKHRSLYEKLREDRLVPDDLDTVLSTLPPANRGYYQSRLLYTLNDTFILDFSKSLLVFLIITEQGVEKLRLRKLFTDKRETEVNPYTGSALARFERSTPLDHKGDRTLVLRFLKIITPVKCVIPLYDGYVCCPKEGVLRRRTRKFPRTLDPPEWSINIDKPIRYSGTLHVRGLQLLWDA